jgi:hypothetical protein
MALWRYSVCSRALEWRLPARKYGRCYTAYHAALFDQQATTINPPWEMVHGKWSMGNGWTYSPRIPHSIGELRDILKFYPAMPDWLGVRHYDLRFCLCFFIDQGTSHRIFQGLY